MYIYTVHVHIRMFVGMCVRICICTYRSRSIVYFGDVCMYVASTISHIHWQGFRELYAITEDFPDFDLHAYVAANTLEFYQGYIKRGLSVVEYERECQAQNIGTDVCTYNPGCRG